MAAEVLNRYVPIMDQLQTIHIYLDGLRKTMEELSED
jgi:hypothetical protein